MECAAYNIGASVQTSSQCGATTAGEETDAREPRYPCCWLGIPAIPRAQDGGEGGMAAG